MTEPKNYGKRGRPYRVELTADGKPVKRDRYGYAFKVRGPNKGARNWARYKRRMKDLDPLAYTFANKRSNAKKNGHSFNLTLPEWRQLWEPFTDDKGSPLPGFHIDRIDRERGYEPDNVQILEGAIHRIKDYGQPPPPLEDGAPPVSYIQKTEAPAAPQDDDLPF